VIATSPKIRTPQVAPLSEAGLLRMPASAYMNEVQLEFFRQRLASLKLELVNKAELTTGSLREQAFAPDPADRATIEEEHTLELRTRDRERKLLKKIEAALLRIDEGEYGFCEETGEPIGLLRLLARPTATLTVEAQERREIRRKMFGD
jgi:DnaK suppressor protein